VLTPRALLDIQTRRVPVEVMKQVRAVREPVRAGTSKIGPYLDVGAPSDFSRFRTGFSIGILCCAGG